MEAFSLWSSVLKAELRFKETSLHDMLSNKTEDKHIAVNCHTGRIKSDKPW